MRTILADAARLFGPQKGATPEGVRILERRLAGIDELAPYARLPGSGAGWRPGRGAGSARSDPRPGCADRPRSSASTPAFATATSQSPVKDRFDGTTGEGKAPGVVAARCVEAGVRCVGAAGRVVEELDGVQTVALSGHPANAETDLEAGRSLVA